MRNLITIFLLITTNLVFAQRAQTILVEVIAPDHYELTITGLHKTVDRITLSSAQEVQKFTGIESQPEINLKNQPDWYRIWFHDGSDPYTQEGAVARIDFHFSSGKSFTMTSTVPEQKQTTDAILDAKAAYDASTPLPSKLDPSTKNVVNISDPVPTIIFNLPAPDPKTDNPP